MARRKKTDLDPSGPPETNGTTTGSPPSERPESDGEAKKRPVVSFRCGSDRTTYLEVAVWENEVKPETGEAFKQYVTTCQRTYKNGDNEWHTSHAYRAHDLPILGHLLLKAHAFITDKRVIEDIPF